MIFVFLVFFKKVLEFISPAIKYETQVYKNTWISKKIKSKTHTLLDLTLGAHLYF